MIVRPAREDDIDAVLAIWNPLIRESTVTFTTCEKSAEDVAGLLAGRGIPGGALLVAEREGTIAGFAAAGQFRNGPGYRHTLELSVHVAERARGRGVGRALVEALRAQAAGAGAHTLYAAISGDNRAALAFHRAMGFDPVAVLSEAGWKFGRWLDLHLMVSRLGPGGPGRPAGGA